MKYALIKNSRVENIIIADEEFVNLIRDQWDAIINLPEDSNVSFNYIYEDGVFTPGIVINAPEVILPPVATNRKITKLAWLNRFTDEEAINIDIASRQSDTKAAMLRRYLQKVDASQYIDLGDPDVKRGLVTLESIGMLDIGRAATILDSEVKVTEAYNGRN